MTQIVIPHRYRPRAYQVPFWAYMENGGRRYVGVWHRRAGKDHSLFAWCSKAAFMRVGLYWHILPTYEMGKKIVWNGLSADGYRFVDMFPPQIVARTRSDEMLIELVNGSFVQVVGGDDPDRLRGPNPLGVIFSEYAFFPSSGAWDVVRPILNENGGWAAFISTPRGRNQFWDIYQQAQEIQGWKAELLTVDDTRRDDGTPVITKESIDEDRRAGYSEAFIQQEYYCSFNSPFVGSIYEQEMRDIQAKGGVGDVPWNPDLPVTTWWDLGINDPGCVWFLQSYRDERRFIDFHQAPNLSMAEWIRLVLNKPYTYSRHIGPWDLRHREQTSGRTREISARHMGLNFVIAPKTRIEDGINEARSFLRRYKVSFDGTKCRNGIDSLLQYRWKTGKDGLATEQPHHDLFSHGADAFRTGVVMDQSDDEINRVRPARAENDQDLFYAQRDRRIITPRQAFADG